jgi:hypothetical protein
MAQPPNAQPYSFGYSGSPFQAAALDMRQPSPRLDLVTWLQQVQYHAQSGSYESQRSLKDLAYNLPDYSTADLEVQTVFDRIQAVVSKNRWDKDLSPTSHSALMSLMRKLSPQQPRVNSSACKKLTFSADTMNGDE